MAFNGHGNRFPINISNAGIKADLFNIYEEIGNPPPPPMTRFRITEAGDQRVIETTEDRIVEN